jgi:hypothetical protein
MPNELHGVDSIFEPSQNSAGRLIGLAVVLLAQVHITGETAGASARELKQVLGNILHITSAWLVYAFRASILAIA